MELMIIYMVAALLISGLCSILEATLMSTPMSYISSLEAQGQKGAALLKKYKLDIERPISAILVLNTIANTVGASLVGSEAMQMAQATNILRVALWIIGLFTLLSGIVGVSNIMLITVRERTREFGIRKAIGASPIKILRIIITESVLVTAFFGYIGMLLGIGADLYMDATLGSKPIETGLFTATMFVNPTVSLGTCIGVTFVLVIAGTIAGLVPAMKAARIRPIEALRAE